MSGRPCLLGALWQCWAPALLLSHCSPAPVHPAASPVTSAGQSPPECIQAQAEASAQEEQRGVEIVRLRSELREHPDDAERWAKLGQAHAFAEPAEALGAFAHATRLAPNVAEYWKQLGDAHWFNTANDPKAAEHTVAALLICLQQDPQRGDCHQLLGSVQSSQGDHTAALQSFTQATEHGAHSEPQMARELLELGELEQSNTLVQTQLDRIPARPGNFEALYGLQRLALKIAERRGDHAQAHAARERIAEYAVRFNPEAAFNLGSTYAIGTPPRTIEAARLLGHFVHSSCEDPGAEQCARCDIAHELLARIAKPSP